MSPTARTTTSGPMRSRPWSRAAVLAVAGVLFAGAAACSGTTSVRTGAGAATDAPTTGAQADADGSGAANRLVIATTVAPITSIVAAIVGDHAEVIGIVPEGTNSHTFEPPPSAAEILSEADIVFVNGLQLEEPTTALAEQNAEDGSEIIELGPQTVSEAAYEYDVSFPEEEGKPNPHLWTNPPMVITYAELVRDAVIARDPANAAAYRANFDVFAAEVADLDQAMRTSFATIPADQRKLLTYHDAYAYFAREYGFEVVGAIQVSDFQDPSPKDVAGLIDQVRAQHVRAIFGSEVFPSPVLEQIGNETGVRYVDVLRDDDLPGEPGATEHSLVGLLRFDYVTMTEALGGDATALEQLDISIPTPDTAEYPQ